VNGQGAPGREALPRRARVAARSASGLLLHAAAARGQSPAPVGATRGVPYQLHRFDEDSTYLRDPMRRGDIWDPVKYVPLDAARGAFLTLGGEVRLDPVAWPGALSLADAAAAPGCR
jgi:hypothetical protein